MLTAKCHFNITHGDCVEGMKQLQDNSVDVIVTSPPYNIGAEYNQYQDNKPSDAYWNWCDTWAGQICRLMKPNSSFFLNVGDHSGRPFFAFDIAKEFGRIFALQNTIHWIKSISINDESYGHFKPINSERFVNDCHEYVFHFTLNGTTKLDRLAIGVPYADKSNIGRWSHTNGKDKRCRGNTWFVPYKTIRRRAEDRPHPATFPVELAAKCIRLHGTRNAVVLDPFLGIGHSALAAKERGSLVSKFIGFEIDEEYVKVACEEIGCDYSSLTQRTHQRGQLVVA